MPNQRKKPQRVVPKKPLPARRARLLQKPKAIENPVRSEVWLQMVLDHFPGLVFVKDINSMILGCNKYFAMAAGKSSTAEVVGKTDYEMGWTRAESDQYRADDREVMEKGEPKLHIIEQQSRPDGQIAWLETSKVPLKDVHGIVIGILGTAHDITERVKAQELHIAKEAAEATTRAKSRFLSHISHEIRTPMIAILGYSQILERDTPLTPQQSEYLGIINKAGGRLLELINDVLEMSKIETGRVELKFLDFNLHAMIKEVSELMRVRTMEKNLEFKTEIYPDLPRLVTGDEGKLRQIFLNLLSNAVKFTDKGSITWRLNGRVLGSKKGVLQLICEVEDTGIGITPADKEKLFQTFQQGNFPATSKREGTGLGLAISRQFARIMDGEITVQSEPGKGSCFKAEVILGKREGAVLAEKPISHPRQFRLPTNQEPVKVLVADDQADTVMLLRLLLEQAGFQVRTAADGKEAVRVFEQWKPRLVFMDLGMPEMDGYTASRIITSHTGASDTVVVAISANVFSEERSWLKKYGVEWFLPKPFREEDLFEMIEKCLSKHGSPPRGHPSRGEKS